MKKFTALLVTLFMIGTLTACGDNNKSAATDSLVVASSVSEETSVSESTEVESEKMTEVSEQARETEENKTEENETVEMQTESETISTTEAEIEAGKKVLVAYFSATHTTEGVARNLADGLGADLYEIVPVDPYTDADLNYNDNNSRSTLEMNDPSSRPAISNSVEDMAQYDIVFLGYPIWWGEAPRIVSTFVESYDFSGKTIIPFCTSGGSGIGSSASNLEQLVSGATWLEGRRLNGGDSKDTIMEWVNSLGLDFGE